MRKLFQWFSKKLTEKKYLREALLTEQCRHAAATRLLSKAQDALWLFNDELLFAPGAGATITVLRWQKLLQDCGVHAPSHLSTPPVPSKVVPIKSARKRSTPAKRRPRVRK